MLKRIMQILNEPFPTRGSWRSVLLSSIMIGSFIGLFLYIFQPFGLENEKESLAQLCLGFGMVTLLCALSVDLVCRFVLRLGLDLPSWTLWKWILLCLVQIAFIAFGNIVFVDWFYQGQQLSLQMWLNMLPGTLFIGLFPIVFSGMIIQMRSAQRYVAEAKSIDDLTTSTLGKPIVLDLNANERIEFHSNEFLFAESMQNYVSLTFVEGDIIEKRIIRMPLKDTLNQLHKFGMTSLHQCHRSFIVNLDKVSAVGGNAQGLKLSFLNSEAVVPVSRTYLSTIKPLLMAKQSN